MSCSSSNPQSFTLTRQTTFDSLRFTVIDNTTGLPVDLTGELIKFSFEDVASGTIILSIDSDDVGMSHVYKDSLAGQFMPIISAQDSELFVAGKLYKFDYTRTENGVVKRSPQYALYVQNFVTDAIGV